MKLETQKWTFLSHLTHLAFLDYVLVQIYILHGETSGTGLIILPVTFHIYLHLFKRGQ